MTARTEYGGQGLPHAVGIMLTEVLCASNLSFAMVTALTNGAYSALDQHATDELKAAASSPGWSTAAGRRTMCLTEPQAGTDLGLVRMKAEPVDRRRHPGDAHRQQDLHLRRATTT